MNSIISTKGLGFLDIIKYPDVSIEENKITFLTGESGCGKSTFLRLVNATVPPSSGKVFYRGSDTTALDTIKLRRDILLCSQDVYLFDATIKENFCAYFDARDEKVISDDKIIEALNTACLNFTLDTQCNVLSGGERQRVFIAVCLSFYPDVLLLDEPTSALDSATAIKLMTNIREYCADNNTTAVIVCHDKSLVQKFADDVIDLSEGETDERDN